MRFVLLASAAALAASCSSEEPAPLLKPGTYFGKERGALCIIGEAAPQRAEFVAFAPTGNTNCAARGLVERGASGWTLVPAGEGGCRIPLIERDGALTFGAVPAACAYYCGPGASFRGQAFTWTDTSAMLLAQEPLGHGGVC